jgi:hypothetical protein
MRQETNNEIDLLLRRLSRRDGEPARDAEAQLDDRHLDADELSSYAQNALPPAARSRYTEHLAECSTCRKLATELSLAVGVTTAAAPVETAVQPSGLKKFLSSLFSPMVLRYAVPALGVIVVMAVGFVVWRQQQASEGFVAQLDAQRREQTTAAAPEPSATPSSLSGFVDAEQEQRPANANAQKDTTSPRENAPGKTTESKTSAPAGAVAAAPAPGSLDARTLNELPVAGPTPAPPAAPKAVATAEYQAKTRKEEEAKRQAESVIQSADVQGGKAQSNQPARDNVRRSEQTSAERADQNKARAVPNAGVGGGARIMSRRRSEESKDDAETRSVAGRQFRKERGIWTDTAYDSSTRTVNMARGSEQFRALVADEPAIGTIAEQLDGEVIVVWKGRAYRIR